jgi:uncharacterized membrane protein
MTGTNVHAERTRHRKRMNRAMLAALIAGTVIVAAGDTLGWEPLSVYAGIGAYWLGMSGYAVLQWRAPVPVRDEREAQIDRKAARLTVRGVAGIIVVGAPTLVVVDNYTASGAPGLAWGFLLGLGAVGLLFATVQRYYRGKHS